MKLDELEKKITAIESRNKNVETNKAWETSFARKITLVIVTYVVIGLTLTVINNPQPWINAIIPTLGFFISTLTLPFVKKYWVKHVYKK